MPYIERKDFDSIVEKVEMAIKLTNLEDVKTILKDVLSILNKYRR